MMIVHFPLHLSKQLVFKMFKERVHNVYFEYFVLLISSSVVDNLSNLQKDWIPFLRR